MSKKLSTLALVFLTFGGFAVAEEIVFEGEESMAEVEALEAVPSPEVGQSEVSNCQSPPSFLQPTFMASTGDKGGGVRAHCEATCEDGSTVQCPPNTTSCSASDQNCPMSRGTATCNLSNGFTVRVACDSCPPSYCPNTPGCNYQFYFATGCCVDQNGACPTICQ